LGYSSNFELTRVEDMHFAAALMSKGFALHGCEMTGDGWGRFALIVPDARKHEVEALAAVSKASTSPEDDVLVPYGAYRRALDELRSLLRRAKGETSDVRRPDTPRGATATG